MPAKAVRVQSNSLSRQDMLTSLSKHLSMPSIRNLLLLFLIAVLAGCLAFMISSAAPPSVGMEFGGARIDLSADRAWILLPGDCATISWELEGVRSLSVDGQDKVGWSEIEYCPSLRSTSPQFIIRAENGDQRTLAISIRYLTKSGIRSAVFLMLLIPFVIALYYLATPRLEEPIPLGASPVLALVVMLHFSLLFQVASGFTIEGLLISLGDIFTSRSWQVFGLVLAGLVFIPLMLQSLQQSLKKRSREDFLVIGAFFIFVLLLFLPFGFDSIGQYEEWVKWAYLDGRPSTMSREVLMRPFLILGNLLAVSINSDSFVGFHLLNLLMFWGKLSLFYGVLRRLQFGSFCAFITVLLFMVYPVNSALMSLRSFLHSLSMLSLLAGINLALDYRQKPSRLRLLGIWLALILTLSLHEIAFAVILGIPLFWLWRRPRITCQNFNMTVIWYLVPVLKIVYLLILARVGLRFYGKQYVVAAVSPEGTIPEIAIHYVEVIANVYRQAFWNGWHEAVTVLSQNTFASHTLVAVGLAGIVMALLAINSRPSVLPSRREAAYWLIGGLFFILPSIGVGMWVDKFRDEFWRLYVYVPFGASIALYGVLLLLTQPIKQSLARKTVVVAISLLLVFPAFSRLFVQHAYFVNSANAKARILLQIVEQVPRYDSSARLMLVTDMSFRLLSNHGIGEFGTNMLDSAIYMLYEEHRPMVAAVCVLGDRCSTNDIDTTHKYLDTKTDYSDVVMFWLHDDLSVELLRELPADLGGSNNDTYNPDRLIDTSAPIPPRALTMLASARRD